MSNEAPHPADERAEDLYILAERLSALPPEDRAVFMAYLESLTERDNQAHAHDSQAKDC